MTKPAISELDLARVAKYCDAKVPVHARDELRIEYTVRGKSVTIFDCRPPWHESVGPEWSRLPVAQLRFDPERGEWTLFCSDRNSRWHLYGLFGFQWGPVARGMTAGSIVLSRSQLGLPA